MAKQARRQRAPTPGPSTSLLDLWRGDLSEVIAAFLPLKAIATMPVSRRFRDRHPVILFSVARRHGALRAGTGALLDAVAATGRDWSRFCSDAADDAWCGRWDDCSTNTSGVNRHIQISTTATGHGRGLVRTFDVADRLCLRRVKYRFSFSDPAPDASHAEPDAHGFAYFCFNGDGVFVCPTETDYMLTWLHAEDDEECLHVEPDTWYDVEITYDWTRQGSVYMDVVVEGANGSKTQRNCLCGRRPLEKIELYNFSPGIARFTAIDVRYSASRPGELLAGL